MGYFKKYNDILFKKHLNYKIESLETSGDIKRVVSADIFKERKEIILNKDNRSSRYPVSCLDDDLYKPKLFDAFLKYLKKKKIKINEMEG
jgi:hypothetical protein